MPGARGKPGAKSNCRGGQCPSMGAQVGTGCSQGLASTAALGLSQADGEGSTDKAFVLLLAIKVL